MSLSKYLILALPTKATLLPERSSDDVPAKES
jgi:hypothetical protein